jgi:hypothetical protein
MMMNSGEPIVPEGTVEAPPAPPLIKPGMAKRNILLIVAGAIVLIALVAFVAYALLLVGSSAVPGTPSATPGTPGTPGSVAPSTSPTAALLPVAEVDWRDVFTPRNPFKVIKPVQIAVPEPEEDTDTGGNNNNNGGNDDEEEEDATLTLEDIVTEDDVRKAVVKLDGVTYTLGAGEQVGDSDWSIVEVNEETVVVLYGDVRIELSIGQGSGQ